MDFCRWRQNKDEEKCNAKKHTLPDPTNQVFLCSDAHNSTLIPQKSILNTDSESARRVENVGDTPRLVKILF